MIRRRRVAMITCSVWDARETATFKRMLRAFRWRVACEIYPRLTAEEIASMAASTYDPVDLH